MNTSDPTPTVPRTPPIDPHATSAQAPSDAPNATAVQTPAGFARHEEAARTSAAEGGAEYELVRELGRGGMGVVYEARHRKLDRTVALKMVLGDPGPGDLIRFLAEAQAVAAVRHENVVRVFDYGERDGKPYMALEFCPGGTLRKLLPKSAADARAPREMAALVAQVARGVAAAHALGIVHRDLKPGNVLLDEAGVPKVADFGLAKRGDADGPTEAGTGMGSPAYMAPEQRHSAKFVGPTADVWALGVILYEALAGELPFTGTVQEILAKAQASEPVPPRKVVPTVPRDLELICLKCLSKLPHERYATAKELADDLDRYARNEPVSVRPAGPLERAVKWVKRNKVVSAAAAAVFLALSVGLGFSVAFGLYAQEQAGEAKKKTTEAENAAVREGIAATAAKESAAVADRERNDAVTAKNKLAVANDKANTELARTLLAPLRADGVNRPPVPAEADAFWRLAALRDTGVGQRLVAEALTSPARTEQFATRAQYVLHTCAGLDPDAHDAAVGALLARFDAPDTPRAQRLDLAFALSYAVRLPAPAALRVSRALAEMLESGRNPLLIALAGERLAAVGAHAPPDDARAICAAAADRLLELAAGEKYGDPLVSGRVIRAAVALSARQPPAAAAKRFADELLKKREVDLYLGRFDFAEGLIATAERSPTPEVFEQALRALAGTDDPAAGSALLTGFERVAPGLNPATAEPVARAAVAAIKADAQGYQLQDQLRALAALCARLAPERAETLLLETAELLGGRATDSANPYAQAQAAYGLAELAGQLPAGAARRVCEPAAKALARTAVEEPNPGAPIQLAPPLAALAYRLPPAAAAELCAEPAARLAKVLADPPDPRAVSFAAAGLAALARYAPSADADRACAGATNALLAALRDPKNPGPQIDSALGLSALARRLPAGTAAAVHREAARTASAALCAATTPEQQHPLQVGIPALPLTTALANHARYLPAAEATELCRPAAAALAEMVTAQRDRGQFDVVRAVILLTPLLDSTDAASVLVRVCASTSDHRARRALAAALANVLNGRARTADAVARRAALIGSSAPPATPLSGTALLTLQYEPRALAPQELVELLKHPFCVGEARRAVLDALGASYNRTFKDQWEFVEYAQKYQPQLDLLAPPKRPDQKP